MSSCLLSGLPDGVFSNQKSQFAKILEGLAMKDVGVGIKMAIWYILHMVIWYILWLFGTFDGYLVHFMVIWYILWLCGTFYGYLVHFMVIWYTFWFIWCIFPRFGMLSQEKSGNPVFSTAFRPIATDSNFCPCDSFVTRVIPMRLDLV
jgi:hypothetical protein